MVICDFYVHQEAQEHCGIIISYRKEYSRLFIRIKDKKLIQGIILNIKPDLKCAVL